MKYYTTYLSPIGSLTLFSDGHHLTGLFTAKMKMPSFQKEQREDSLLLFKEVTKWLNAYFDGKCPDIHSIPLLPAGTAFQKEVWNRLCRIPYGSTVTYGEIAAEIAEIRKIKKMSAQAVGQGVGANPISIVIPCHRVVGANGALTGYAGGVDVKSWLLNHEKTH